MRRGVLRLGMLSLLLTAVLAKADEPAGLRPLAFLLGEWASEGSGQPGPATGTATFSRGLQDRVIIRSSFAERPAADGKPASRHDDLMVIHATPDGVRAEYWDNEGHVIDYAVTSPAAGQAVFLSAPKAGEPTFRLTYTLASDNTLDGSFEIEPPGSSAFLPYLSWRSRKGSKPAE